MKAIISFYKSSIGKKWIVALTGLVLVGFVTGHMIGNLQLFLGYEALNKYAAFLQGLGELLWIIRGFLGVCLIVHIVTTALLWIQNNAATPQKYAVNNPQAATIAAKTMIVSGLIVVCFLVFHLLHFTALYFHPDWKLWEDPDGRHDVYSLVITGFRDPLASGFYLLGLFLLCMHLSHGIQSFIQTLGVRSRKIAQPLTTASPYLAGLIFLGYAAIPVACLLAQHLNLPILQPLAH
ncbi:MAG: succinate dehydrogenase cytochrome b subunit [Chthoniobacteraceae bacterium]|nr:succinate dehydrogenase cytochrome b subunit [Chthoniobacteraceae bacterium]